MSAEMKLTEPKVDERRDQHYAGIRVRVAMSVLDHHVPVLIDELLAWLDEHQVAPTGQPLLRFHVIDMDGEMDVEADRGLSWDRWDDPRGDAFGGRVEYFLDGPDDDPDPATWDTEVAIRLADAQG